MNSIPKTKYHPKATKEEENFNMGISYCKYKHDVAMIESQTASEYMNKMVKFFADERKRKDER